MTRVVVVGASLAGLRSAEALRQAGFLGEIIVVGDEAWAPYNRPPLSKTVLRDGVDHRTLVFRVRSSASEISWMLGVAAEGLDLDRRTVRLKDGRNVNFDALIVATGVRPVRISWPADGTGPAARPSLVLRTLDDARAMRRAAHPGSSVIIVGAGFLGSELATTARSLGCVVHMITKDAAPMEPVVGRDLGAELQRRHERLGVVVHCGTSVQHSRAAGGQTQLLLDDGETLSGDVVIQAVGSRPNTGWMAGSGLDLSDGVRTDREMRAIREDGSIAPGVYAAGDIACFPNPRFDSVPRRVEHWQVAVETGRLAAAAMLADVQGSAGETTWDMVPTFWSDQCHSRLQAVGMPGLATSGNVRLIEGSVEGGCVFGYFRGRDMVAAVGLDMPAAINRLRPLVGRSNG